MVNNFIDVNSNIIYHQMMYDYYKPITLNYIQLKNIYGQKMETLRIFKNYEFY